MEIVAPLGMTQEQWDSKVISAAEDYEKNNRQTYNALITSKKEGNCNSSSLAILEKAALPQSQLNIISQKVPGINIGMKNRENLVSFFADNKISHTIDNMINYSIKYTVKGLRKV